MKEFSTLTLKSLVVGGLIFAGASSKANAELLYAVTLDNNLISFDSATPGSLLTAGAISGLQTSETLKGLDFWNGALYGIGSFSHLYALNPATRVATQVGSTFSPLLNGLSFGVDNGPAGVVVTTDLRQNLLVDRTTGMVTVNPSLAYAAGDPHFGAAPRVDALAYDQASGKYYAGDSLLNTFATLDPTTGLVSTLAGGGVSGIDFSRNNGFDISIASGIGYLASPAASADPQANLYTVNKTTGFVTLVGLIGSPGDNILISGLTAIPEPSSLSMLALGGLVFGLIRRKK